MAIGPRQGSLAGRLVGRDEPPDDYGPHTAPSRGTSHVPSVTDTAGRVAWQSTEAAGFTNQKSGDAIEIFYGVVKSAGATTVEVHWSGTTFDHFVWAAEWRSSYGAAASWSLVAGGSADSLLCTKGACAYPSLTSGRSGGLYWGWAYGATVGKAGTTAGFSYYVTTDPTHGNVLVSDPSLAPSTAYAPTFGQVSPTSWYDAVAVVVAAT